MSADPVLSVVIPCYNRPDPLRMTLRSVAAAVARLGRPAEVLLVDDGSQPPIAVQLGSFDPGVPVTQLQQHNQGSIVARLAGLAAARGEFVLFLDSDDVIHPDKLARQVEALEGSGADVCYADMARAVAGPGDTVARFEPAGDLPETGDGPTLFIEIQPAPHNPIYRRSYLRGALARPVVAGRREMDPSGDVWLYYNLSVAPARIAKVRGHFTAAGPHVEDRYSSHWERLGAASLLIMEEFIEKCPATAENEAARRAVGEAAFRTWRGLPRDFAAGFRWRMLSVFQRAPRGPLSRLGGGPFGLIARIVGPVAAGRVMRLLRSRPYSESRTLSEAEYDELIRGSQS